MNRNNEVDKDRIEYEFEIVSEGLVESTVCSVESLGIGEYLAPDKCTYTKEELERIKDDAFRFHIFIRLFEGNIDNWLIFLETQASEKLRKETLPFVLQLKQHIDRDSTLIDRIRKMVLSDLYSLTSWDEDDIALFKKTQKYEHLKQS